MAEITQEDLVKLVQEQREIIAGLTVQLAANKGIEIKEAAVAEKPKLPKEPVDYNGKKYQFLLAAFRIGVNAYTAEEASVDESIMAEIVAIKDQSIVKELV